MWLCSDVDLKFLSILPASVVFRMVLKLNVIKPIYVALKFFGDRTEVLAIDSAASHARGPNALNQRKVLFPGLSPDASIVLMAGVRFSRPVSILVTWNHGQGVSPEPRRYRVLRNS